MNTAQSRKCAGCPHPEHLGPCFGRNGGTAYQCGCMVDTLPEPAPPLPNPDNGHGAGDGFGGSDFPTTEESEAEWGRRTTRGALTEVRQLCGGELERLRAENAGLKEVAAVAEEEWDRLIAELKESGRKVGVMAQKILDADAENATLTARISDLEAESGPLKRRVESDLIMGNEQAKRAREEAGVRVAEAERRHEAEAERSTRRERRLRKLWQAYRARCVLVDWGVPELIRLHLAEQADVAKRAAVAALAIGRPALWEDEADDMIRDGRLVFDGVAWKARNL